MRHAQYGKRRPRSSSFRLDGSLLLSPFEVEGKGSETGQHKVERIAVEDHGGGCDPAVVERSLSFTESYRRGRGEDNDWGCSHHVRGEGAEAAADTETRELSWLGWWWPLIGAAGSRRSVMEQCSRHLSPRASYPPPLFGAALTAGCSVDAQLQVRDTPTRHFTVHPP
ncbi:hypothetical protein BHE74_00041511, partial [Ensete ventricosum]